MPMMTGEQYRKSLLDGRRCYIDGELVKDPGEHPLLRTAVDSVARTYDRFGRRHARATHGHARFVRPRAGQGTGAPSRRHHGLS